MFLKQLLDFLFAIILSLLLSPFIFTISLVLYFFTKESVFYTQMRVGLNGKEFKLYKFRTMYSNPDIMKKYFAKNPSEKELYDKKHKLPNDPRITKIGFFLREYSLDELPQILNVLKCEMSFIGPRPIEQKEVISYGANGLKDYVTIKPGLSGLWQVSGRNNIDYKERVEMDKHYIKNRTFCFDIKIFFKTFAVILTKDGAY